MPSERAESRLGLQTISWGSRIPDFRRLASEVHEIGYYGLEIAQQPHTLPAPAVVREVLGQNQLTLLGLAGGSLHSRLEFSKELSPLYLYVDEWDDVAVRSALTAGVRIALHPYFYKEMDTVQAAALYLDKFPGTFLILDTAHAFLAGDDLPPAVSKYWDRIIAIHLKDWTSKFGRTANRFGRGFTTLGKGDLSDEIKCLVTILLEKHFPGWLIVEQDSPDGDPIACAEESRAWLRQLGL